MNEPSRWGCQWERDCSDVTGTLTCAPGAELYHRATMAIHNWDSEVPIFANAMGQSHVDPHRFPQCSKPFRGECVCVVGGGCILKITMLWCGWDLAGSNGVQARVQKS